MTFGDIPKPIQFVVVGIVVLAVPLTILLAQQRQTVSTNAQGAPPEQPAAAGAVPAGAAAQPQPPAQTPQSPCKGSLTISGGTTKAPTSGVTINNPLCLSGIGGANDLISFLITMLLIAVVLISFFMLVMGGIQYITSGGDPKGAAGARNRITYAIIGLAVAFTAFFIITLLGNILGFTIIQL